ncbi:cytidylate kinase family protein [Candidatus Parcubacteria bacterium]|nr:cytidylate kinase family protein [Candidatus Parcubacteria bacterium]
MNPNKRIITIAGLAGVGKSALCKAIQNELGWKKYSAGDLLRQMAEERGMTINEIDEAARHDPQFDRALDERTEKLGQTEQDFVIDGRLAWKFIPHSLKVNMTCDEEVRLTRVAHREGISIETARERTRHREETITDRYKKYYDIDNFLDPKNFDLVLDTTSMTIEEELRLVLEKIQK